MGVFYKLAALDDRAGGDPMGLQQVHGPVVVPLTGPVCDDCVRSSRLRSRDSALLKRGSWARPAALMPGTGLASRRRSSPRWPATCPRRGWVDALGGHPGVAVPHRLGDHAVDRVVQVGFTHEVDGGLAWDRSTKQPRRFWSRCRRPAITAPTARIPTTGSGKVRCSSWVSGLHNRLQTPGHGLLQC